MLRCQEYRFPKLAICGFVLSGWLVVLFPIAAQATPGPTEVIRQFCGQLLDVMQHATTLGAKGRYQKLEPIVLGAFDLPFMARLSTGPSWAKLSSDQKRRVAQAYGRYTTAVYATRFDGYSGERFEFLGEQNADHQSEWRAGIDQFRAARQRHCLADPRRLSRQCDQRAGDAALGVLRIAAQRWHRCPDRLTQQESRRPPDLSGSLLEVSAAWSLTSASCWR